MTTDRIENLADTRNTTPAHLVMTFDMADTELAEIIRTDFGVDHITDSVIDDILDELSGADYDDDED